MSFSGFFRNLPSQNRAGCLSSAGIVALVGMCGSTAAPLMALDFYDLDEVRFQDLRLQVGTASQTSGISLTRVDQRSSSQNVTWESSGRWSLLWAPPVGRAGTDGNGMGFLEIHSSRLVSGASAAQERLVERAVMVDLHLGLGWMIMNHTTLELTGFGGAGPSWQEGVDEREAAWEVGGRLGITWAPAKILGGRPLLGLAVLASYSEWNNPAVLNGEAYDLTIKTAGIAPAGVIGWRF